ncbi:hypothetical protein BJ508DRAFT_415077 [Ascobolus immersus RN42]|uniref:Uncharacterized protein n=1 Tax=Ascobolus immersus RN42 TaxID=1160509 RepID=A0A3N4I836_ASCIM|nr:hypothetical protein BJ508DRAFT_415077 [Ascobolus immersus RN42]
MLRFLNLLYLFLLLPIATFTTYRLYTYTSAQPTCSFPRTDSGSVAPFRLLVFADPQLEGNTSLKRRRPGVPVPGQPEKFKQDVFIYLYNLRKRIDLFGNDYYLRHIFSAVRRVGSAAEKATHNVVLGDLLGSQWIDDEEFWIRAGRVKNRVFAGMQWYSKDEVADSKGRPALDAEGKEKTVDWANKLIAVAGNHDIGYAGDMNRQRVNRFEEAFGPLNSIITVHPYPDYSPVPTSSEDPLDKIPDEIPSLRLINLNSMALDTPIYDSSLSDDSYALLNAGLATKSLSTNQATVLLTHLPFHKTVHCSDQPYIAYFPEEWGGGIKTQNFLSDTMSALLLGWNFGMPSGMKINGAYRSRGVILTGHDHVGCDVRHVWREEKTDDEGKTIKEAGWDSVHEGHWQDLKRRKAATGEVDKEGLVNSENIREVTVTSMMGDYGGNVGFLSAWWDKKEGETMGEWKFAYNSCRFGYPLAWWAVHVTDLIVVVLGVVLGTATLLKGSAKKGYAPVEKKKQ